MPPRLPAPRPLRVPAGLWDDPDVKVALVANDFGALFRFVLDAAGGTQEALGHRVGLAQSDVSQILRGERAVTTVKVVRSVVEGLDMPDDALELLMVGAFGRTCRPLASEEDPMDRRDVLKGTITAVLASGVTVQGAIADTVSAAARRPDPTTADHLAGMVQNLRELDGTGSLAGYSAALVELCRQATQAARSQDRPAIGRVLAEAATEHWWQTWLAPGVDDSSAFQEATSLAIEWDEPALVGHLLGFRSSVVLREKGDPAGALRLAQLAQDPRWRLSPGEQARAADCEMRALAALDDHDGVGRAVDIREEALSLVGPDTEPAWLRWLVAEADLMTADCQLVREGVDAVEAVEAVLVRTDTSLARTHSIARSRIATARLAADDVEGALIEIETVARLAANDKAVWSLGELSYAARRHASVREALGDYGVAVPA